MIEEITYGDLFEILVDAGFEDRTAPGSHTEYWHEASDTLVLLAPHKPDEAVRAIDIKYVRRVLNERGLLDGKDFDRRVAEAYSAHSA